VLTEQSWIFGGAGNDVFYADGGNSVLVGGSGSNVLFSGRGYNILIGGSGGRDLILGTQGNNVEIAGSTNCDANEAALAAILAEWSTNASSANYAARVAAIAAEMTISQGTGCDYLFGGIGQNTYFAQTKSVLARDYIFGQKSSELVTQI
jgi:Ca2+-binding RTX toxin-like protein